MGWRGDAWDVWPLYLPSEDPTKEKVQYGSGGEGGKVVTEEEGETREIGGDRMGLRERRVG